ncbi:MAG: cupredoxin family protein [Cytophagales bacterium]|nr:cupredoxin family protein [Rhizobacter sp.]
MNTFHRTLAIGLLLSSSLAFADGKEKHGASAPAGNALTKAATKAADGHAHGHGDAIGVAGKPNKVSRTVTVDMTDTMRFNPASVAVKQGETIRFVVKNSGQLKHEFVLGTEKELEEHYEVMKKFPEMEHDDPNMVTVAPGKAGEVIWQFTQSGKVDFACLQPGHYDAGMKGAVTVAGTKGAAKAKTDGHVDHKH